MRRRSRAARLLKASAILARGGPPPNKNEVHPITSGMRSYGAGLGNSKANNRAFNLDLSPNDVTRWQRTTWFNPVSSPDCRMGRQPCNYGPSAANISRSFMRMRLALAPTLIAAGSQASVDGTPIAQRLDLLVCDHDGAPVSREVRHDVVCATCGVASAHGDVWVWPIIEDRIFIFYFR